MWNFVICATENYISLLAQPNVPLAAIEFKNLDSTRAEAKASKTFGKSKLNYGSIDEQKTSVDTG